MNNEDYFKNVFQEFYKKHYIKAPYEIEKREFGIGFFGKKIGKRHMEFKNNDDLNLFLKENVPMFISCSDSLYEKPRASPMNAKGWLGSDITYEFDADDISEAEYWYCECGKKGKGKIEKCPECGKKVEVKEWFSSKDLEGTKKEMLRLIDCVENDFEFKEYEINFSGNAGYHLHLRGEEVRELRKEGRIELVDYLKIENYNLVNMGFYDGKIPEKKKGIAKKILKYLREMNRKELVAVLGKKFEGEIEGNYFPDVGKGGGERWEKALDYAAHKLKIEIDRQTSVDIHKILRVPNTLHGGTGLLAKKILVDEFKEFNPLDDCVVLGEKEIEVYVKYAPKFYLKGEWGPYWDEKVKVPEYVGVYLIGKGVAEIKK